MADPKEGAMNPAGEQRAADTMTPYFHILQFFAALIPDTMTPKWHKPRAARPVCHWSEARVLLVIPLMISILGVMVSGEAGNDTMTP